MQTNILCFSQAAAAKASEGAPDGSEAAVNVEGQMYVESKSYVVIEVKLHRPLVPKRQPEDLAKR